MHLPIVVRLIPSAQAQVMLRFRRGEQFLLPLALGREDFTMTMKIRKKVTTTTEMPQMMTTKLLMSIHIAFDRIVHVE
jgi:hypothetical protein